MTELHLGSASAPVWNPEFDDRLICLAVQPETHDITTFVFRAPEGRRFAFEPGQFLTFAFEIGSETVNRCYTLASSPLRPYTASITVKRVPGGVVSGWLHDHMKPGVSVQALGPMGAFSAARHPAPKYLFLSGGSGITPVMSMSRAFADTASPVDVVFLHAARTPRDLVFRAELDLMARRLPGFRLLYLPERADGEPGWAGPLGRLSHEMLSIMVPDLLERTVFCCGPAPFMASARQICTEIGLPEASWHQESFDFSEMQETQSAAADQLAAKEGEADPARTFKVTFTRLRREIDVKADRFVLSAAREAGVRLPMSCTAGLCGTCKSKLVSGRVEMTHQGGIRQREIDIGMFLPCCSKPLSDLVIDR